MVLGKTVSIIAMAGGAKNAKSPILTVADHVREIWIPILER